MRTSPSLNYVLNANAIVARSGYTHPPEGERFREFYRNQELTNCLEMLSDRGFSGNSEIFLLSLVGGER
jgi:hypothetical protein